MATFITTVKFTPQGMKSIQDTCKRAAGFKEMAKKAGCTVKEVYWTPGPFDGLLVFEAPDGETATGLMLRLCELGNVQTQTTRAFTASEMEKILASSSK